MQKYKKPFTRKEYSKSSLQWGLAGVVVLFIVALALIAPNYANRGINFVNNQIALGLPTLPESPFKLGLDLRGGAHLLYATDLKDIPATDQAKAVEGVRDVIERRVNALGVGESEVRTSKVGNDYRIDVELPGVSDVNTAIKRIGDMPILEFREENTEPPRELTADEQKQITTYNKDAKKKIDTALAKLKKGADFATVAKEVSTDEASKNNGGFLGFVSKDKIDANIYKALSELKQGQLRSTIIDNENSYYIIKRGAQQDGQPYVTASHILICSKDLAGCATGFTDEEAKAEADRIYKEANAGNFADLAKEFSADPGSSENGGDLGEFTKGAMIPEFENAVFGAEVNQIVGPVKTQFGYHIIYKRAQYLAQEYETSIIAVAKKTATDFIPPREDWTFTGLSGRQLARAEVTVDSQTRETQVSLRFNDEGKQLFGEITKKNLEKPLAIFLDGEMITVPPPTVRSEITNGEAVISGGFTLESARLLAQRLNAGALPVPVELISQETIGATLGADSLQKSMHAGFWGMIVLMIFMVVYYRLPGVLANISLCIYLSLTLVIFKSIGVTMSLSGIAGIILSIGMAVDANVLIFERTKEELRRGHSFASSIEDGFIRAWSSIRDSNVSTLISAVLMIWFGSSFVRGFATTLALGVLISMFTAITVTRLFLRIVGPMVATRAPWLFLGYTKKEE